MWMWIGVAAAVVVIAAVAIWFFYGRQKAYLGPAPVHAPEGQVVDGFPRQLILGTPTSTTTTSAVASSSMEVFFAGITNSYSINYSTSTNQYTAEWLSSSTPATLYKQYQSYIEKNGWTITNHNDLATFKSIYATNASSGVNIVLVPQSKTSTSTNKGSKVTVTYIGK